MMSRLRRLLRRPATHPQSRTLLPEDPCHCTIEPMNPVTPMGLNEMPDAWATDQDVPVSLRPGDLRVERMALGFDETRGAGRTLEYYDRALSCACPAGCIQHPWRPTA